MFDCENVENITMLTTTKTFLKLSENVFDNFMIKQVKHVQNRHWIFQILHDHN